MSGAAVEARPALTDAGRAWAERNPGSIVASVALYGVEGGWPEPFVATSIRIANESAEEEG